MVKNYLFFLFLLLYVGTLNAQIYSNNDVNICNREFKYADEKKLNELSIGSTIVEIGKSFLGTNYSPHTLETGSKEELVVNLSNVDCTTFLENTLALARCVKGGKTTFNEFEKQLSEIRYRDGIINGYPSRLNYFSDWIYDNEKKGIIKNISKEIGGEEIKFNVNFMSTHPDKYIRLKDNPSLIPQIKKQEKEISKRLYYYIPKEMVASAEKRIQSGDIIAFTSAIKGLDINHVGIAVKGKDGNTYLLHAPNVGYKVQIADKPLPVYVSKVKNDTGIIVLRPLEP